MAEGKTPPDGPALIKKYANRRLYNTATASFVTLDDLHEMVKRGEEFTVQDAKTGKDLTNSILAQIIAEEESRGSNLFSSNYLRQILKLYSDGASGELSSFMERSMESFASSHNEMLERMQDSLGAGDALEKLTEMGRQNFELFQKSMQNFAPAASEKASGDSRTEEIDKLTQELAEMQKRLDALSKDK